MRPATSPPAVSIIMPCHNSAPTIVEAISSVRAQTFGDWELIVVDDGSQDHSAEIAGNIDDQRIKVIVQSNQGAAGARNRGLGAASGDFVAFLDSDDAWEPVFLEHMLGALKPNDDAVLAYCGWQNLGLAGGRGKPFVPPDYDPLDRSEVLLGGCRWPIHGVLVRRSALKRAGGFDETLRTSEDYDLWFRVAPQGRLVRVPEVLAYYRHHDGEQITKNRLRVALNHLRAQEKFLRQNPGEARRLGRKRVRELVAGDLLRRAYISYWERDLPTARTLFRKVMRAGYGRPRDWMYMLPALLPISWHKALLAQRDATPQTGADS